MIDTVRNDTTVIGKRIPEYTGESVEFDGHAYRRLGFTKTRQNGLADGRPTELHCLLANGEGRGGGVLSELFSNATGFDFITPTGRHVG